MVTTTVNTHATVMRDTIWTRPSRGSSSAASNDRNEGRATRALIARAMVNLDRSRHSHVHGIIRRMVQPDPHRKSLCNDDPVQISAHFWQVRSILVSRLNAHTQALDLAAETSVALRHCPDGRGVSHCDPG